MTYDTKRRSRESDKLAKSERYVSIVHEVRKYGILTKCKGAEKTILLDLAERAHRDTTNPETYRTCFPNQTTLAKELDLSVRTIKAAIKRLVEAGILQRRKRAKGKGYIYRIPDAVDLYEIAHDIQPIPPKKAPPMCDERRELLAEHKRSKMHWSAPVIGEPVYTNDRGSGLHLSDVDRGSGLHLNRGSGLHPKEIIKSRSKPMKEKSSEKGPGPFLKSGEEANSNGSAPPTPQAELNPAHIWESIIQQFLSEMPDSHFAAWIHETRGIAYDGLSFTIEAQSLFDPAWLTNDIGYGLGQAFNSHRLEIPSFCIVDPTGQALTRTPQQIQQEKTLTPPPPKLCDCGKEVPPDKADKHKECRQCWEQKHKPTKKRQPSQPIWTPHIPPRQAPNQAREELSPFEQARTAHIDYRQASIRHKEGPPAALSPD